MKTIHLMTATILAGGLLATACANGDQSAYDATTASEQSVAQSTESTGAEASAAPMAASFIDEIVYDESGVEVGTVAAVGTASATGSEVAIITVGNYLGMGAKNIALPASELSPRAEGGLTVAMTSDEIQTAQEYTGALPSDTTSATPSPDDMTDPAEPMDEPEPQQ